MAATPSIFRKLFQTIADDYGRVSGERILLRTTAREQNAMAEQTILASISGDLPDVAFEGYEFVGPFTARGLASRLDPLIAADHDWPDAQSLGVAGSGSLASGVFGLRFSVSVPVIYYNADLLGRAGVERQVLDQGWPAITDAARKIARGAPSIVGGFCQYLNGNWVLMALIESQGARIMGSAAWREALYGPAGLQALTTLRDFGLAGQAAADMSRDQARQAFLSGAVGLLVDSSSSLNQFLSAIGGRFELGTAAFPIRRGSGRLPAAGLALQMFADTPDRRGRAWRFMRYAVSAPTQALVGRMTGYIPANRKAIEDPHLLGDDYSRRPLMQAALARLGQATPFIGYPTPNSAKIADLIDDRLTDVITLREPPAGALSRLAADTDRLLAAAV